MNVITFSVELLKLRLKVSADLLKDPFHEFKHFFGEQFFFSDKNQIKMHEKYAITSMPNPWYFTLFYSLGAVSWAF